MNSTFTIAPFFTPNAPADESSEDDLPELLPSWVTDLAVQPATVDLALCSDALHLTHAHPEASRVAANLIYTYRTAAELARNAVIGAKPDFDASRRHQRNARKAESMLRKLIAEQHRAGLAAMRRSDAGVSSLSMAT